MGIDVYNQQAAITEDPYMLILKLYEGLLKYLSFIEDAIEHENIEEKFEYINKSIAIFDELRNILDFEGGDISYYLDGLYLYQIETLFSAGINNNLTAIAQVSKVVKGLIEAWKDETGL
jgi:flagellar protein FliS